MSNRLNSAPFGMFHLRTVLVSGMGFLCDSYDLLVIGIVFPMIALSYSLDNTSEAWIKSSATLGTLLGQLLFGWMGDRFGRKYTFGLVLVLMIVGTVSSAASVPLGGSTSLVVMLSISRFVLGLGIGGDYPLAGVITSEFASTSNRGMMIASVFAMQGAGILLAAIVAVVMLSLSRTSIEKDPAGALNFVWRICILAGIVPGICALYFRLQIPESPRFTAEVKGDVSKARQDADSAIRDNNAGRILVVYDAADGRTTNTSSSLAINNTASSASSLQEINEQDMEDEIDAFNSSQSKLTTTTNTTTTLSFLGYFSKWTNLKVLLGTSFTWFCLDVGFYGCNLNTPLILKVFGFGGGITVFDQMWNIAVGNLVVALLGAVPGYIASVLLIEKMGRRKIQFMGFAVLTILFAVLAAFFNQISSSPVLFVFLYALVQFFNNFGPNTTTFVVAAEVFPTRFRTTAHGIAAASGKLGAILASSGFATLKDVGGGVGSGAFVYGMLWIFCGFMVLGGCFTFWIPETAGKSLEEILQERECNLSLSDKRVEENARGWRIVSLGWPLSLIHRHSTSPERNDEDYFELDEDF